MDAPRRMPMLYVVSTLIKGTFHHIQLVFVAVFVLAMALAGCVFTLLLHYHTSLRTGHLHTDRCWVWDFFY
jgi:hypothetical protein